MLSASCMLMHMEHWFDTLLMHGLLLVGMSLFHTMQYTGNIWRISSGFHLILMYLGSLIACMNLHSYKPLSYCNNIMRNHYCSEAETTAETKHAESRPEADQIQNCQDKAMSFHIQRSRQASHSASSTE